MAKETVITQENFNVLLSWLDHDPEIAAQKYEKIRQRLIRIFTGRGCFEAEDLTDETLNRVTQKMPQIANEYTGEPSLYFYGVANKIHLEWLRTQKKVSQLHLPEPDGCDHTEFEIEYECLEQCLEALSPTDRRFIVDYYTEEKSAKIEIRQQLAKTFGISTNALQIKAFRLRGRLKTCVQNCVGEKI